MEPKLIVNTEELSSEGLDLLKEFVKKLAVVVETLNPTPADAISGELVTDSDWEEYCHRCFVERQKAKGGARPL